MIQEIAKTFFLNNVRAGRFVHLITPRKFDKPRDDGTIGDPKYEMEIIIPKNHPQIPALRDEQRAKAQKAFGAEWEAVLTGLAARDRVLLHNGDATRLGKPEYAGQFYINAKNKEQPLIIASEDGKTNIATQGTPKVLLPSSKVWPYPGCMVNVELDIFGYRKGNVVMIGATLMGVQFAGHAPRLGMVQVSGVGSFGVVAAADVDGAAPARSSDSDGLI